MYKRTASFALVLLLLTPVAVSAVGQRGMNQWRNQAKAEMQQVWQRIKADWGFGYAGDMVVGALNKGAYEHFEFDLVGHREYLIKAICDGDCGNVDLYVYDRRNNLVGGNDNPGNTPAVRLGTGHDGRYKIQASMVGCRVEPCFYAVQVFHRYRETP